jgi:hypothetical protein
MKLCVRLYFLAFLLALLSRSWASPTEIMHSLVVNEPADCYPPSGLMISNVTATTARAVWNPVSGATAYQVFYRLYNEQTWTMVQTTDNTIRLSALASASRYAMAVGALCVSGSSGPGNTTTFHTQPASDSIRLGIEPTVMPQERLSSIGNDLPTDIDPGLSKNAPLGGGTKGGGGGGTGGVKGSDPVRCDPASTTTQRSSLYLRMPERASACSTYRSARQDGVNICAPGSIAALDSLRTGRGLNFEYKCDAPDYADNDRLREFRIYTSTGLSGTRTIDGETARIPNKLTLDRENGNQYTIWDDQRQEIWLQGKIGLGGFALGDRLTNSHMDRAFRLNIRGLVGDMDGVNTSRAIFADGLIQVTRDVTMPNTPFFMTTVTGDVAINRDNAKFFSGRNAGKETIVMFGNGDMTSKGRICANRVSVMIDPACVPDFVFDESYKLMSLDSVEAYVKLNKHLPEVPSAAQVGADGLDVGEMNLILLKKVEELTLHVIALKKQIQAMEQNQAKH